MIAQKQGMSDRKFNWLKKIGKMFKLKIILEHFYSLQILKEKKGNMAFMKNLHFVQGKKEFYRNVFKVY